MADKGAEWKLVNLLCRDTRALSVVLEFLRLSETPVDDIATALAFLSAACGQGHTVCATVIHTGFHHYPRENLLRGTSFHVTVLSEYTRCWGGKYLNTVLSKTIASLLKPKTQVEIDTRKTLPADMRRNTVALVSHVDKIIGGIITTKVPPQIKEVLLLLHQGSAQDSRPPMSTFLIISTLLFLRFICPALVSPELYSVTKEKHIGSAGRRKLILVAKILQNIANENDPFEHDDAMLVLSDCIKDSISSVREWTHSIFAAKLSNKADVKKAKRDKLLPYRSRLCSYLQTHEDAITRLFQERMGGEQREEERDYVQIAHYRLIDAMDERRREIGADPVLAQSFEKVWERVERRTNRLHKLDASGMSSSGSFLAESYGSGDYLRTRPAGTSTTTGSSLVMSTSTEITDDDDDTGADTDDDSFAITDDSCLSEKSSCSATKKGGSKANGGLSPTRRSSAAQGLPLASPRGRSKSMGDASFGGGGAAGSPSRTAISRGDADLGGGGPKLVFKCWRNNKRKIFTVPAKGITYVKFVLFLYKKLDIESHQPLRLCHRTVKSSGGDTKLAITDEASFKAFLADHGTAKDATTTYSLWVE